MTVAQDINSTRRDLSYTEGQLAELNTAISARPSPDYGVVSQALYEHQARLTDHCCQLRTKLIDLINLRDQEINDLGYGTEAWKLADPERTGLWQERFEAERALANYFPTSTLAQQLAEPNPLGLQFGRCTVSLPDLDAGDWPATVRVTKFTNAPTELAVHLTGDNVLEEMATAHYLGDVFHSINWDNADEKLAADRPAHLAEITKQAMEYVQPNLERLHRHLLAGAYQFAIYTGTDGDPSTEELANLKLLETYAAQRTWDLTNPLPEDQQTKLQVLFAQLRG